jgi:tetratricopeptide (TPR) repeat protein
LKNQSYPNQRNTAVRSGERTVVFLISWYVYHLQRSEDIIMGTYFSELHASASSQLNNISHELADSPEVHSLRNADCYEQLMDLGKALSYQLRYREATEIYTKAILQKPDEYTAYRQRAAKYLSTLQTEKAFADFLTCRKMGGDEQDLSYRLGLCHYFSGNYLESIAELEQCYHLCDDEMGIAAIFWHTLSAWRCGAETMLLQRYYHANMQVGHHTGYAFAMKLAAGEITFASAWAQLSEEPDDLEFSMKAYGVYAWLLHCNRQKEADDLLEEILRRDSFWISYGYLAAWNDRNHKRTAV